MKFLRIMRPLDWTKNIFVFAALIFGKKLLGSPAEVSVAIASAVGAFFCFSLVASAVYIFNDIIDRHADKLHPQKRLRPIAAGTVNIGAALVMAAICAVVGIVGSFALASGFGLIIVAYIALMILYAVLLKRVMILDCVVISVGFCLRAVAGAVVVGVFISPWLIICTFALCLFLAFSKRKGELGELRQNSELFRRTLGGYTPELLAHMLDVSSGLAVVCFLLYAMDDRTLRTFGTNNLVYTTPLVLYCIFRFSALIQRGRFTGPLQILLKDLPFQIGLVLWVLCCIAIVYANQFGFSLGGVMAY
jgi:4-hydroxybenzoate polyprenyltransferase